MRSSFRTMAALTCLAAALGSCGGGGGGGSPPPPAPVPPPPPPPPPAVTARAFTAVPVAAFFYFYSSRDRSPSSPDLSGAYGNRVGQYGSGTGPPIQSYGFGTAAFRDLAQLDSYSITAAGIEHAGSTFVVLDAPAASRAFSPTTSLIEWSRNQDQVKRALGLDGGVFALSTNPDLLRFDAVAALASADPATRSEGARVAAANLRAMAVAAVADRFGQLGFDPFFTQYRYRGLGDHIATRNGAFLFENTEMSRFLGSIVPGRYRDDVIGAAAHLVDAYAAAIGVQVADTEQAARFTLGIRGYLLEEVDRLLRANTATAAAAALAVTAPQILDRTARYREVLPFPATGLFFPGPDFCAVPAGGQLVLQTQGDFSLGANDFYANGPTGSIGFFPGNPGSKQVLAVSVPAANAGQASAVLRGDGTVLVTALGGFTGITYFDYAVRHESGEQGSGRVYVTVR